MQLQANILGVDVARPSMTEVGIQQSSLLHCKIFSFTAAFRFVCVLHRWMKCQFLLKVGFSLNCCTFNCLAATFLGKNIIDMVNIIAIATV